MQIFVVGMHRSGTSAVSRILNLMGIYFGTEGISTGYSIENKKGFWERKDVRGLNDFILQSNNFDWYKISKFNSIQDLSQQTIDEFNFKATKLLLGMDAFRPWFIKEPRICLTIDLWKELTEISLCIYVYRNPIQVANSLKKRNEFPLEFGLSLWEKYNTLALKSVSKLPIHFVNYNELIDSPYKVASEIQSFLTKNNVPNRKINESEIVHFIDKNLYHHRNNSLDLLDENQKNIYNILINKKYELKKIVALEKNINNDILSENESHFSKMMNKQQTEPKNTVVLLENKLKSHEVNNNALKNKIESKEELINSLKNTIKSKEELINSLKNTTYAKEELINSLKNTTYAKEELINSLRKTNDTKEKQHTLITKENKKIQDSLLSKETQINLYKESIDSKTVKINSLKMILDSKEVQVRSLKGLIESKESQIKSLEESLKLNHAQIQLLKKEITDYTIKISDIKKEYSKKLLKNESSINEIEEKNNEINILRNKINEKDQLIIKYWDHIQSARISNRLKRLFGFDKIKNILTSKTAVNNKKNTPSSILVTKKIKNKSKIYVVCWDMSHNPVGRAFLFADVMKKEYDVELFGPIFSQYGNDIWSPLKDYSLNIDVFEGKNFPEFLSQAKKLIKTKSPDFIIICKPRLPSILIGLLMKKYHGIPCILDIDDHELSFFKNHTPLKTDEIDLFDNEQCKQPFSEIWTRVCESLVSDFKLKTVSNKSLQNKFGGNIIPHIRDENKFNPSAYDRDKIRSKYKIRKNDKVILFAGTPRKHKGLLDIAKALNKLNDRSYKLCITGNISDVELKKELKKSYSNIIFIENISFNRLPKILRIADLICILQDINSPISKYQMPAKFSDALSMGIPVIGTEVKPFEELQKQSLIHIIKDINKLDQEIKKIFENYEDYKQIAISNRKTFLKKWSYENARKDLMNLLNTSTFDNTESEALNSFIFNLNKKYYDKSREPLNKNEKLKIVIFWKQNDSDLYGRRQDMITKYLAAHDEVEKIIHFDAPIDAKHLLKEPFSGESSDNYHFKYILNQTRKRVKGIKINNKLFKYSFVFDNELTSDKKTKIIDALGFTPQKEKDYYKFIKEKLTECGIEEKKAIFWFYPLIKNFKEIISLFNPAMIISDIVDDQRGFTNSKDKIIEYSKGYETDLSISDLVFCNTNSVKSSMSKYHNNITVITNGLEKRTINDFTCDKPNELSKLKGPIIGYSGNLDTKRLDINLLRKIANHNRNWNIVLIGSAHNGNKELFDFIQLDNVHFLGVKPHEENIKYIRYFDVAIIPHHNNQMTQSMNPLKLYVYYSLGIKVVTTKVNGLDLANFSDSIKVASSHQEFVNHIDSQLSISSSNDNVLNIINRISKKDLWEEKVNYIIKTIKNKSNQIFKISLKKESPYIIFRDYLPTIYLKQKFNNEAHINNFIKAKLPKIVDIVIPIYNNKIEIKNCINSIFSNDDYPFHIYLVNDCSKENDVIQYLNEIKHDSRITLINNDTNKGFVKSANIGINASTNDVILLNSDTEVTPRWIQKLLFASYSREDIATATPFSNASGAFSVPDLGENKAIPHHLSIIEVAKIVENQSVFEYHNLPTGNGFCMLIKRKIIGKVGLFDEISFGRGYGEENDFCMRCLKKGYKNVLVNNLFIFHKGNVSFGSDKEILIKTNRETLNKIHPEYTALVKSFINNPNINEIRNKIGIAYNSQEEISKACRPNLLYVLHQGGGGVINTTKDLSFNLKNRYNIYFFTSDSITLYLKTINHNEEYILFQHKLSKKWNPTVFYDEEYERIVYNIILTYNIEVIHIRHLFKHYLDLPKVCSRLHIPYILSFHDYYFVSPSINLLDENGIFKEGINPVPWHNPTPLLNKVPRTKEFLKIWKNEMYDVIKNAKNLVSTTNSLKNIFEKEFQINNKNFEIIEHGRDFNYPNEISDSSFQNKYNDFKICKKIKILVLGNIDFHKGSKFIASIAHSKIGEKIEFHFAGSIDNNLKNIGVYHGSYTRDKLNLLSSKIKPHIGMVPSIIPETFSHALTELWYMGLPVIGMNLGAVGERIKKITPEWLLNFKNPLNDFIFLITKLENNPNQYLSALKNLSEIRFTSVHKMSFDYDQLYKKTLNPEDKKENIGVFCPHFGKGGSSFIRIHLPYTHPVNHKNSNLHLLNNVSDNELNAYIKNYNISKIIIQRNSIKKNQLEKLVVDKTYDLIFEIDDDILNISKDHPQYLEYKAKAEFLDKVITHSDEITVSTNTLKNTLLKYNKNITIIKNKIDEKVWFNNNKLTDSTSNTIKIGYFGTKTHSNDLEIIKNSFITARNKLKKEGITLELELIGVTSKTSDWYTIKNIPADKEYYIDFVGILKNVTWDIGIAPLADKSNINNSKSAVKFLEYTAMGIPGIYSNIGEYKEVISHNVNGILATTKKDWLNSILKLATDKNFRDKIFINAQKKLYENHVLSSK